MKTFTMRNNLNLYTIRPVKWSSIFWIVFLVAIISCSHNRIEAKTFDGRILRFADADSFFVEQVEVRLNGIDSFELDQYCGEPATARACGREASAFMRRHFFGKTIRCRKHAVDQYQRYIVTCLDLKSNRDLAEVLVEAGLAISTSRKYRSTMQEAQSHCRGVWQYSKPIRPKEWRRLTRGFAFGDVRVKQDQTLTGTSISRCEP